MAYYNLSIQVIYFYIHLTFRLKHDVCYLPIVTEFQNNVHQNKYDINLDSLKYDLKEGTKKWR